MRRHLIFLGLAPLLLVVVAATPAVSQEDIQSRMQAWSKALGVECSHCHAPDRWTDTSKPTYAFSRRMMRMVDGLNAGPLSDLGGVTCWTCHRGRTRPARLPRALWEGMRMLPIFDAIPTYFDTSRMPQTQCYMCHQGKTKPER